MRKLLMLFQKTSPDTSCTMRFNYVIIIYSLHFLTYYRNIWKTRQVISISEPSFKLFYKSTAVDLYPIFQKEIRRKIFSFFRHRSPI